MLFSSTFRVFSRAVRFFSSVFRVFSSLFCLFSSVFRVFSSQFWLFSRQFEYLAVHFESLAEYFDSLAARPVKLSKEMIFLLDYKFSLDTKSSLEVYYQRFSAVNFLLNKGEESKQKEYFILSAAIQVF